MTEPDPSNESLQHDCSLLSLQQEEQLAGSAPRVDVWFLLGYDRPMGAKAFAESAIPEIVKERLNVYLEAIPRSRLLLIKPRAGHSGQGIEFHAVQARELDPYYRSFRLRRYEDLLDLDIRAAFDEGSADHGPIERDPFFVVCTNGRRDACCARYGLGVFDALSELGGVNVWQCSHVSGHRFAANAVSFPHGIYYGRLRPENAGALPEAGRSGELLLEHYRGRASYEPIVQAGEALLRRETGVLELAAYRLVDHKPLDDDRWAVHFATAGNGQVHRLTIRGIETAERIFVSCRSEKQAPLVRYKLISHQVED